MRKAKPVSVDEECVCVRARVHERERECVTNAQPAYNAHTLTVNLKQLVVLHQLKTVPSPLEIEAQRKPIHKKIR